MDARDKDLVLELLAEEVRNLRQKVEGLEDDFEYMRSKRIEASVEIGRLEDRYVELNNEYFAYRQKVEQGDEYVDI